jgi:hypothetical protein
VALKLTDTNSASPRAALDMSDIQPGPARAHPMPSRTSSGRRPERHDTSGQVTAHGDVRDRLPELVPHAHQIHDSPAWRVDPRPLPQRHLAGVQPQLERRRLLDLPPSRDAYRSRGCTPAARACPVVKVDGSHDNLPWIETLTFLHRMTSFSIHMSRSYTS